MAIEITVDTPVLKGEKGDKGDTGSFDYGHLEDIVIEHLDGRFSDVDADLALKVDKEFGKSLIDDEYIPKLEKLETLNKTVVETLNDKLGKDDIDEALTSMEGRLHTYVDDNYAPDGDGIMLRATYDTDNDGVIDLAGQADNADTVNNLTVETAVPENAVFTDTTYDLVSNDENGLMSSADKIKLDGIARGATRVDVVDSLESTETGKALSANQGNVIGTRLNLLEDKSSVKLFEGAVAPNENETVTLNESMNNYKFLVFLINSTPDGAPFGYGIYPVIDQSKLSDFGGQSFIAVDAVAPDAYGVNAMTLYSGRFRNLSDTQIQTIYSVRNIVLRSKQEAGGGTQYYIRQIWGIR